MKLYAVIPTHNRPDELVELLGSIPADVEVLVIDNASEPPFVPPCRELPGGAQNVYVIGDEEQPPNLSRLWNMGLDWAQNRMHETGHTIPNPEEFAVAILNDDVVLGVGTLFALERALERTDTDIAFPAVNPGFPPGALQVNQIKPFPGTAARLTGWCFMVRGSSGLRADESLRWWCGDDDLQANAVTNGRGTVRVGLVPEDQPLHRYPDQSTTGVLREQTEKDMTTFVEKWGQRPW